MFYNKNKNYGTKSDFDYYSIIILTSICATLFLIYLSMVIYYITKKNFVYFGLIVVHYFLEEFRNKRRKKPKRSNT